MQAYQAALLAALALAGLELITGTFVLLGFCLACLTVAAADLGLGRFDPGRDAAVFAVVAILAITALRLAFARRGDTTRAKGDVNEY